MKTITTLLLFVFIINSSLAQEKNLETKSVLLEDLISFIAKNYSLEDENTEEDIDNEEILFRNITFLIEAPRRRMSQEDIISLKQSFRFLSKRLSESDNISIVAYSGLNGLVLPKTSSKSIKKVLYALDNFKAQIDKECEDGITYAYEYANKIHEDLAHNYVVMVRNPIPNPISSVSTTEATNTVDMNNNTKKNNGAIILTAITLLPEIIAVIKD